MRDTFVIALEAAWEHDTVRLDDKLWGIIAKNNQVCYNTHEAKKGVENLSKADWKMRQPCGLEEMGF